MGGLETTVHGELYRNDSGRLRVRALNVQIVIHLDVDQKEKAERCLAIFEEYCTVTASIRKAIEVSVSVVHQETGEVLYISSGVEANENGIKACTC